VTGLVQQVLLTPIPLEIKSVSIRIYTDTPKELITFANMYLKNTSRIGFYPLNFMPPNNIGALRNQEASTKMSVRSELRKRSILSSISYPWIYYITEKARKARFFRKNRINAENGADFSSVY